MRSAARQLYHFVLGGPRVLAMFSPSTIRYGQMRFAASQLSQGLFVRYAVAAISSTVCASKACIRQKSSTMPNSGEPRLRKVPTPWTLRRRQQVKKSYFHQYSSPVVNLNSCFSTLAIQHTRGASTTPRAAAPEATRESSERTLAKFHRTIDKKETHFFNKHSADWWDVNGPFAALHDYTPHRVEFLISNLQTLPHYQEILRQRVHSEAVDTSCSVPNPPPGSWSATRMSLLAQGGQGASPERQSIRQSAASPGFVRRRAPFAVGRDPVPPQPRGRLDGCTVLDVGCGGGILSEALAREGSAVVGVDAAREAINVAEHRRLRGTDDSQRPYAPLIRDRQRYVNGSLEDSQRGPGNHQIADNLDPLSRNSLFDIVVFSEVLEHIRGGLDGVERLLAMAAEKCLKPGGLLMVTTLNRTPENYLISIVAAECVLNVVPQGTHSWEKFIKPEEISLIGERHGLRLIQQRGFTYVPFIRIFVDEPFCRIMYMMAFEKV